MKLTLVLLIAFASSLALAFPQISDEGKCMERAMEMNIKAEDAYQTCSIGNDKIRDCIFRGLKKNKLSRKYSDSELESRGSKLISSCQLN
jgi:hypothetical protein